MSAATAVLGALMADRHWPADASNPCSPCLHGDPHRCTGVGCYRCTCGCRDRRHGMREIVPETAPSKPGTLLATLRVEP